MTLNITYRPFVYYRCNVSFGDMLHSTHGIDHYPCSRTNRMVCENGGNCYTGAGRGAFQCLRLIQDRDI